jgi:hypothetical protein
MRGARLVWKTRQRFGVRPNWASSQGPRAAHDTATATKRRPGECSREASDLVNLSFRAGSPSYTFSVPALYFFCTSACRGTC